ncbi:hypothetical protein GCM10010172_74720 [Paractinoplanes ferrugineus]|uniref:Protein-glutamine gamma-glutamyltransferase-like C-terminal domain-containing protein n=1 Tax=Paractinoplanes ferrugineus TaxID=113564 RepID=A0A919MD41_9ACTN|nr:DUF4129 domain-containing protein [Actinoplanes ferrugineus]GIE11373.1 hypothetical protein Afe05nite_32130 [Actinoplanes ferrugineus]
MTRAYDEFVAAVFERVGAGTVLLLLLLLTALIAALWYWFPAWVPRRMPRLRFPRLRFRWPRWRFPKVRLPRRRRSPDKPDPAPADLGDDDLVQPDAAVDPTLADRLAAEGRYAEAIRQRLRDTVTDLTRAGVIAPVPGSTADEISRAAAARQPVIGGPLSGATEIFSEIWYGRREASPGHDERMRALTTEVRATLGRPS